MSFCSVQLVGAVIVAGLVALPTSPTVGLPVRALAGKDAAGVPIPALVSVPICMTPAMVRIAAIPVLVIPETPKPWITAPVAASPGQLKVTVMGEAAASFTATNR